MTSGRGDFCTIDEAMAELRGGMIILVDDEFRENEGDLVIAAEKATPEDINFMMRNACGLVCLADVGGGLRSPASRSDAGLQRRSAGDPVHARYRRADWHHHRHIRV